MFATIRRYQGKSGQIKEVTRRVQQGLVPILSKQKGFVSYHVVDGGNDVVISVSLYQDRAGAEAANTSAAQWVQANLADLVGSPQITVGEVTVSAVGASV
jgi:heme-degrading monooxygenase HmoA